MTRLFLPLLILCTAAAPARAYVDAAPTVGAVLNSATHVVELRVDKVSKDKRVIIYSKVSDLKGQDPAGQVKHQITDGLHPREPKLILDWAEPGRLVVCFHNKVCWVCLGTFWYECARSRRRWWRMTYGRWDLSLAYSGSAERCVAVADMLAGKEAVVTATSSTGAHGVATYDAVAYRGLLRSKERPVWQVRPASRCPNPSRTLPAIRSSLSAWEQAARRK